MNSKSLVWTGLFIGSSTGAFLPYLWGDYNPFSFTAMTLSAAGAILGIWIGFKISQNF